MKYILIFLCALHNIVTSVSCGSSTIDTKPMLLTISNNAHLVIDAQKNHDSLEIGQVISSMKLLKLKPKDSLYLTGSNKIIKVDDKFLLCDYTLGLLILFDSTGNEIAKIGDLGTISGHYPSIKDFAVDFNKNEIFVFSNQKRAILRYRLDGTFIEEHTLPFYGDDVAVLDTAKLVFFLNQNTNDVSGENNLLITDLKGNVHQRAVPIDALPHMGFAFTGFMNRCDSSILFAEAFSDSIYEINSDQLRLKYAVLFGDKTFPYALKSDSIFLSKMDRNYNFIESGVYETGSYLYCRYQEERRVKHLVFNKASSSTIKPHLVKNGLGEFLFYITVGGNDGEFYSIFNYDMLQAMTRRHPKLLDDLKRFNKELHEQIVDLKPNDNPVIFILKFNC